MEFSFAFHTIYCVKSYTFQTQKEFYIFITLAKILKTIQSVAVLTKIYSRFKIVYRLQKEWVSGFWIKTI